ncbi:3-keto-5-aminohexanoate cleavage protein [Brevibacillus massiliensis]|jgi:3-keto-5-aminohexanoate cleavage enzyme|uniref:3-keto-5-aminohexanoate cleavage protein n=1 Tax=Brevibacillus massiliensis TaxID=1118054 RepID=UPI0002D2E96F|nr:3-keto-5-aminohexanoate cleavage protein [Brevibacillus massiliensis]
MENLIITVATTGAVTTRRDSPYLPITPQEIADSVYEAWQAGAAVAHIHVRDQDGNPSMDYAAFAETVKLIRERCDIVLNLTSSGGLNLREEDRLRVCELEPELVSFDAGSMNFGGSVFLNPPDFLERLAQKAQECNVKPEIEVFEAGMIANALQVAKKGWTKPPFYFQFVLGVPGGMPATPKNLLFLSESIPAGSPWSAIGIGKHQLEMNMMAIAMGGHVRVGMEDNVYYRKGELARTNAQFVERIVRLASEFGRQIATPDEARELLGLRKNKQGGCMA